MNNVYEYTNVSGSERLESFFESKIKKLEKKYPFITRADIFFKKENTNNGTNKNCGIRISAPGPRLYAEATENSFEEAITTAIKSLDVQLEKKKSLFNIN